MPKYTFSCQTETCLLRFERSLKIGEHPGFVCPSCHELAPRVLEGFSFDFKETSTSVPGNTGVHKDDYPTADHAVGKDADKKWDRYRARDEVKKQVREAGQTHALNRVTATDGSYIEYSALNEPARQVRRAAAKKAVQALSVEPQQNPSAR